MADEPEKEPCDKLAVQKFKEDGDYEERYGLVVQKRDKDDRYALRHECCQGVCWNALIRFVGRTDLSWPTEPGTPITFSVLYPIVPCGTERECNMANDYDTDACMPTHQSGKLQWGSAVNPSGFVLAASNSEEWEYEDRPAIIDKGTVGNIGVYFGQTEIIDPENPENDRPAENCRIFARAASLYPSMWQCQWFCDDDCLGDCGKLPPNDVSRCVIEKPLDCLFFDDDTDADGVLYEDGDGNAVPVAMNEPIWGSYYYQVLPGRACSMRIRTCAEDEYGNPMGNPQLSVSPPPTGSADARFRLEYPPSEDAEAWLAMNLVTTTIAGCVFKLNAEMIEFIGDNPAWSDPESGWRPPDLPDPDSPLADLSTMPDVPKRNLLLYAGKMHKICGNDTFADDYEVPVDVRTIIDTAEIIEWTPCHIKHQCIEAPFPEYEDLVVPPRGNHLPPPAQPCLGSRSAKAPSRPVCLHLEAATGQCLKYGGDAACDACRDRLGAPIDID